MTKERKIALELWEAMRKKVSNSEITDGRDMQKAKRNWLEKRGIDWYCECWFCHYFRKAREDGYDEEETAGMTHKCPLNSCRPFSRCGGLCLQYSISCNERYPMEQRLAAVDNIIKALKGEHKER